MTNAGSVPNERSLLIVEDDKSFLQRLARAMEGRGFAVTTAESVADGLLQVEKAPPAFAVVDMRLADGNGLDVISAMKKRRPDARAIILTGYGNIATAVTAVKLGAVDYLAGGCRRRGGGIAGTGQLEDRAAGKPHVGGPGALGAHSAHLRIVRPQRLRNSTPPQHASPHTAAYSRQARAEIDRDFLSDQTRVKELHSSQAVLPRVLAVLQHVA
jgi:CheY-like chemotaxis protein